MKHFQRIAIVIEVGSEMRKPHALVFIELDFIVVFVAEFHSLRRGMFRHFPSVRPCYASRAGSLAAPSEAERDVN